jgi:hypothetical protein
MLVNLYCIDVIDFELGFIVLDRGEMYSISDRALKKIKALLRKKGFKII